MLHYIDANRKSGLFWIVIIIAAAALVWLAPEEKQLGQGIRSVYVHVALIWVGMAGLVVAGLVGIGVLFSDSGKLASWMEAIGWVALGFYAAGVSMSILASKVNWGSVFWQEPRMKVALNMLALALIVEVFISWVPWRRLKGLLSALLVVILSWTTMSAPLVLHPRNPIGSSSSSGIKLTFLGLSIVSAAAAAWIVWFVRSRRTAD